MLDATSIDMEYLLSFRGLKYKIIGKLQAVAGCLLSVVRNYQCNFPAELADK
jgi:hypothetical protein